MCNLVMGQFFELGPGRASQNQARARLAIACQHFFGLNTLKFKIQTKMLVLSQKFPKAIKFLTIPWKFPKIPF